MTAQDLIDQKKREIAALEAEQQNCPHSWGLNEYNPRKTGGHEQEDFHFPRPGRMVYVPEITHKRWTRRCTKCGKIEHTERTKSVSRRGTIPGTTATEEVPDFGDDR